MARKITYGAKGNVSKVKAKKDIPKKVDSEPEKPKRVVKKKPTTKELLNSLDTETIVRDLSTYDTPEKLKEEESEEQKLYDNSYISKDLSNYKIARDEVEIDDYLYSKLKTKALEQSEVFTDWDVKIGDPESKVRKNYLLSDSQGHALDKSSLANKSAFCGDVYWAIMFVFDKAGKVKTISIGAFAE